MSELVLKKWVEDDIDKVEKMKVLKPTRIKAQGDDRAKAYKQGDEVSVSGMDKKDMYYQNKIVYPQDYEKAKKALEEKHPVKVPDSPPTAKQVSGKSK